MENYIFIISIIIISIIVSLFIGMFIGRSMTLNDFKEVTQVYDLIDNKFDQYLIKRYPSIRDVSDPIKPLTYYKLELVISWLETEIDNVNNQMNELKPYDPES